MKRTTLTTGTALGLVSALAVTAFSLSAGEAAAVGIGSSDTTPGIGSSGTGSADQHNSAFTALIVNPDAPGQFTLSWHGKSKATVFASTSAADPSASGKQVAQATSQSATVSGLDPIHRWYFEVADGHRGGAIASTRQFVLSGAHNVRDIGGYSTKNGRTVAWGKVFRGDSLNKLTADDDQALTDAAVKHVVDYRGDSEIAQSGADKLPASAKWIHVPVLDDNTQALATALVTALNGGDPAVLQDLLGDGKATKLGDEGFIKQLQQPDTMAGYAKTMQLIADSNDALLYHCTSGKDRTGMMTALLLGLLGVPNKTIVDDFVLSNKFNRASNDQTYAYLKSKGIDVELVKPLMEQRASEIQPVLDAVQKTYGGWDAFATKVLKLSPATIMKRGSKLLV